MAVVTEPACSIIQTVVATVTMFCLTVVPMALTCSTTQMAVAMGLTLLTILTVATMGVVTRLVSVLAVRAMAISKLRAPHANK
jgi:hypothetical protein